MLGSVVALANTNGEIVERYAYDPYGTTTILDGDGNVAFPPEYDPTSDVFFHDVDMNDQITSTDDASMTACLGSADARCVWLHDPDGSNSVDFQDQGIFYDFYPPGGAAPPEFGMPARGRFDSNGDGYIDLWDFYGFQQALGSQDPILLTIFDADTNGTVTTADYTAYATAQAGPGAPSWTRPRNTSRFGNPYMWTGQRRDATTGQYHFSFRSYSPRLGRWLQRDPLGYVDGVSRYEYVGSDPGRFVDSFGSFEIEWEGEWTEEEKEVVLDGFEEVRKMALQRIGELEEYIGELATARDGRYEKLITKLKAVVEILRGMVADIDSDTKNLEIYKKKLNKKEVPVQAKPYPYIFWVDRELHINTAMDFFHLSVQEILALLFHELSHFRGTEDGGPWENDAHRIDDLSDPLQKVVRWLPPRGDKLDIDKACENSPDANSGDSNGGSYPWPVGPGSGYFPP